jgi:dTDP-glucose 4,6-dehydratase
MTDRILVTGGAGFIGANFIHFVLSNSPDVFILNYDLLTYAGSLDNVKDLLDTSNYVFVKADICDQNCMMDQIHKYNINMVVHFAAESHVDRSISGPSAFVQANITGTFSILEVLRKIQLDRLGTNQIRFHHISTDEVFGSLKPGDPPFTEKTPYSPNSPYAASKASSDHLVRAYHHTYNLPVTITNCSNNYGPYQFPEKLIPLIILNALEGKELPIYGDGQQIRDWLYVDDHCEAIWEVLHHGIIGESYNVGGNNQHTNLEIVDNICVILDELMPNLNGSSYRDLKIFVKDRPGHDRRYAMDITKIQSELGWQPKHGLHTGLRKAVEWYLSNSEWITSIRRQNQYNEWVKHNYTNRGEK